MELATLSAIRDSIIFLPMHEGTLIRDVTPAKQ